MENVNELHIRASVWYEDHELEIEAFQRELPPMILRVPSA